MARPRKAGLDYFPFDVNFFSDKKIRILKSRYGADGIELYLYLICETYKSGYYIQMDEDYIDLIHDELHMSSEKVMQVMKFLLERSLLDSTLFQSDTIITSLGIQRRFQEAVRARGSKSPVEVDARYWLLSQEETQPFIKVVKNPDYSEKNPDYSEKNPDYSEKNTGFSIEKSHKVKESKVNKSINTMCKADALALFEDLWNLYPSKKGKARVSEKAKLQLLKVGHDEMVRAIDRYKTELSKDSWRHPQNGSTFFNSGYVDYLDANYVPGQQPRARNDFLNCEQSTTDYAALEKMLG